VGSGTVSLLTTVEERADICEELGIDRFVVVPFTREFSRTAPQDFVQNILIDRIGMREMIIGHDHHFGHGRTGNENLLLGLADSLGFSVDVVPAQLIGDGVVSSSEIRRLLIEEGDVARAAAPLGSRYRLTGSVVEGLRRGREIGFPTANLIPSDERKVIPKNGVYSVVVRIDNDAAWHPGMMNIGHRPSFEDTGRHLEVHLIGYEGELYGRTLHLEFIARIRSERKFDNIDGLVSQLHSDRERCIALAAESPVGGNGASK
jgi:riboflavin kinase/FMN adenylyltransferase